MYPGVMHPGACIQGASRDESGECIHGPSVMHPPPLDIMTDDCENITFPIHRMRSVNIAPG